MLQIRYHSRQINHMSSIGVKQCTELRIGQRRFAFMQTGMIKPFVDYTQFIQHPAVFLQSYLPVFGLAH